MGAFRLVTVSVCVRLAAAVLLGGLVFGVGSAGAAVISPGWLVHSVALPTVFSHADSANASCSEAGLFVQCDAYESLLKNAGAAVSDGSPVVFSAAPPVGVTVQRVSVIWPAVAGVFGLSPEADVFPILELIGFCGKAALECEVPLPVAADETIKMTVFVTVDEGTAGPLTSSVSVSGGGAAVAEGAVTAQVGAAPGFGPASFDFYSAGLDGLRDTQAGDHPYELTVSGEFNSVFRHQPDATFGVGSVQDPKDVVVDLPLGFVASILATPQCTFSELSSHISAGVGGCPKDTIVGHLETEPVNGASIDGPIYNMTPERGVPAEFAYVDVLAGAHVFYSHVVPTPAGYVLRTVNPDLPQIPLTGFTATFFGDPAVRDESGNAQIPFFTNPTSCGAGPLIASMYTDSWQNPGSYDADGSPDLSDPAWVSGAGGRSVSPPVTGCNGLRFVPEVGSQPTTHQADAPSGLSFEIKQPQPEETGTRAASTLKTALVRFPAGFTIDPSAGDGLAACSEAQIGWVGPSSMSFDPAEPSCPEASKIGSLEIITPLIPGTLTGAMYLAAQDANPFDTTFAAYVVVDDPVTGVLIKIAGQVLPDAHTGQLTAVFDENPQLPFSDLRMHFFGGPRAEFATPEHCGTFTTVTQFTPWSAPDSGPAAEPFDSFPVDEGCPTGAFSPTFAALSTNVQAGAYTPFLASFSRSDTDQELSGLTVTLPEGLLAKLAGVPLCTDTQAATASCPEASRVGSVVTSVGPGPTPLQVHGEAYLTGPYNGGPYGLAVVVPAVAGPFDFGTVVVRQSIRIDPHTAQATDVSDPFPKIIAGVPLRLRRVDLTLDRPEFTFNPTSCNKKTFTGVISGNPLGSPTTLQGNIGYSTETGSSLPFTTPFQVTNCGALAFAPKFTVSTSGKTSRANGASLTATLSYPNVPIGSQTNIASAKFDLPLQLPSRLTTLQKACTSAQFQANPAGCPPGSKVGTATVTTPLLPDPLTGPAIFVSHGGEAFPSLTMVLQGNNVTIDLVGTTFISKGITSTNFKTVPDTPFTKFTLTLPEGPNSALGSFENLCSPTKTTTTRKRVTTHRNGKTHRVLRTITHKAPTTLVMPTRFTAQNGALITQNTPITVTSCTKPKKATTTSRHKKHTTH